MTMIASFSSFLGSLWFAGLAFVVGGARWAQADGQIMFILVLTLAAAEASVGLALLIQLYRRFKTLDIDAASTMKG